MSEERRYRIDLIPQRHADGRPCWFARHPELFGCQSHGNTPEQALTNLADARRMWLAARAQRYWPPPQPYGPDDLRDLIESLRSETFAATEALGQAQYADATLHADMAHAEACRLWDWAIWRDVAQAREENR